MPSCAVAQPSPENPAYWKIVSELTSIDPPNAAAATTSSTGSATRSEVLPNTSTTVTASANGTTASIRMAMPCSPSNSAFRAVSPLHIGSTVVAAQPTTMSASEMGPWGALYSGRGLSIHVASWPAAPTSAAPRMSSVPRLRSQNSRTSRMGSATNACTSVRKQASVTTAQRARSQRLVSVLERKIHTTSHRQ
ncbi:hypothetical protein ACFPRL_11290 [Pseudoclavibacter helvolus]